MEKKLTKEEIEKKFKEIFFGDENKIGVEDNGKYGYTINLGNGRAVHTNDAGLNQFNEAMREHLKKLNEEWNKK